MTFDVELPDYTIAWLEKRALEQQCTVEDFISLIVVSVHANYSFNIKQQQNETTTQTV